MEFYCLLTPKLAPELTLTQAVPLLKASEVERFHIPLQTLHRDEPWRGDLWAEAN